MTRPPPPFGDAILGLWDDLERRGRELILIARGVNTLAADEKHRGCPTRSYN